jgi:ATP-dependent exoDNAse (exonuclease V) beta subunit
MTQLAALADRYDALHADLRPSAFVEFVQQQRQEEPSSARIRVMNIHQSKGLEFDIVILPELDSSLYQFPKYVSRSPSPGLPPHVVALYRQQQHFEVLGGELLAARQATRDRLFQESLCVLYVALTRAARSLHLLIAPKVSKKHPKSFSGLIRAAVAPQVALQPHQVIWEQGDRDWFKQAPRLDHVPEPTDKPAAAADDDTDSRPIRFASSGSRQILRRLAPSHSPAAAVRFGRTGSSSGSSQGRVRGTLFHRWLQEIEWLQPDSSLPARLEQQVAQLGGSSEESREWGAQFQDLLRSPWGLQLLSRAGYQSEESLFSAAQRQQLAAGTLELQVRNEIPFAIQRSSNTLVSGCIDRLVILKADGKPVAADVIDFKTDNVTTDQDIAECVAGYHDQMIAYHQAVMQLLQLPAGAVTVRLALIQPRRTVVVCGK